MAAGKDACLGANARILLTTALMDVADDDEDDDDGQLLQAKEATEAPTWIHLARVCSGHLGFWSFVCANTSLTAKTLAQQPRLESLRARSNNLFWRKFLNITNILPII
jgi:hypothetical protein